MGLHQRNGPVDLTPFLDRRPAPPAPDTESDVFEIDLRSALRVVRRQWRVIGYAAMLVLGAAAVYLVSATPKYTASALLAIEPAPRNLLDTGAAQPLSGTVENARIDGEVEILRSDAVALATIQAADLVRDPEIGPRLSYAEKLGRLVGISPQAEAPEVLLHATRERLKDRTSIRRRGTTYLVSIDIRSTSPARAATIANTMAEVYIELQLQAKRDASFSAGAILESQIDAARADLAAAEAGLDTFVERNAGRLVAEGVDFVALRDELRALQSDEAELRARRDAARAALAEADWKQLADRLGDAALARLERQRAEFEARLAGLDPAETEAVDIAAALARIETRLSDAASGAISATDSGLAVLDAETRQVRERLRAALAEADLPPDLVAELYEIGQEQAIALRQYQTLLSRMREIETQARVQMADARVVSPALAPIDPTSPNARMILVVAAFAALGIGATLAFLNEYHLGGVRTADELEELLATPVATSVPLSAPRSEAGSLAAEVVDAPLSLYAEAVRRLRAEIDQRAYRVADQAAGAADAHVVVVTSTLPAEGKTTTALSLARTYAQAGKKTLLIDADLRKPSVHLHLGCEIRHGFLDFLRDPTDETVTNGFYARDPETPLALILGASRSDMPTDQLLNSATFETLLTQARQVYDIIVIDTPPLMPVVDARYVVRYADTVAMIVRWGRTNRRDLRRTALSLRDAMRPGAAFLTVLSHVEGRADPASYAGYYGDYAKAKY